MPPENLPSEAKKIYVAAEERARKSTCKDREDKDECIAKIAWSAVKSKFRKDADGNWIPKAEVSDFSMAITKTSYDKSTDTRRWRAVASDITDDLYEDNMTLELFNDFLQRIESKEQPPESFRSAFWDGGVPYLSISHYPDLDGKGVPGPIDAVYVDGEELKSSGRFNDTPIGRECFKSISKDFSENVPDNEKIRISIAFLDWMHRHKSNGYVFDRAESDEPICPECLIEIITNESEGKEFLRGHLVHLALTRVPVNTRTSMEVRSMTTRKEDAESIVGEEIAEELDEQALFEGKSEALVIKSDEEVEPEVEEKREKPSDYKEDDDDEEEEEGKKKKKQMKEKKAEVKESSFEEKALHLLEEIRAGVDVEPEPTHPLDIAFAELKSVYDEAIELPDQQDALVAIQEPLDALAAVIQNGVIQEETNDTVATDASNEIAELRALMTEQLGLVQSQIAALNNRPQQVIAETPEGSEALTVPQVAPERRSVHVTQGTHVDPNLFAKPVQEQESETPKLTAVVRKSVGLDN